MYVKFHISQPLLYVKKKELEKSKNKSDENIFILASAMISGCFHLVWFLLLLSVKICAGLVGPGLDSCVMCSVALWNVFLPPYH